MLNVTMKRAIAIIIAIEDRNSAGVSFFLTGFDSFAICFFLDIDVSRTTVRAGARTPPPSPVSDSLAVSGFHADWPHTERRGSLDASSRCNARTIDGIVPRVSTSPAVGTLGTE